MENVLNSNQTREILDKRLQDIKTQRSTYSKQLKEINDIQNELKSMSLHPRHSCLIPVSNYVYSDATLINTEYLVRHGDYRMVTSQQQTNNYMENIKKNFQSKVDDCTKEIDQLEERMLYLTEFKNSDVQETDQGFMITRGEFVEIIEEDPTPINRERVAKFKSAAERDEFIKNKLK